MPFAIRHATLTDLPAISALGLGVNLLHATARPDVFAPAPEARRLEPHWRRAIEADGRAAFIAERDGVPLGFITGAVAAEQSPFVLPSRICHVGTIGVVAAERGRGIGRALMAQLEDWAAQCGANEVQLMVWAFNDRARTLYRELGYEERCVSMGKRIGAAPAPGLDRPPAGAAAAQ